MIWLSGETLLSSIFCTKKKKRKKISNCSQGPGPAWPLCFILLPSLNIPSVISHQILKPGRKPTHGKERDCSSQSALMPHGLERKAPGSGTEMAGPPQGQMKRSRPTGHTRQSQLTRLKQCLSCCFYFCIFDLLSQLIHPQNEQCQLSKSAMTS